MFGKKSRYLKVETVTVTREDGEVITAVKLRPLDEPAGKDETIKGSDQLDFMSEQRYDDPARFWHIADANTELEAEELVKHAARVIKVPVQP